MNMTRYLTLIIALIVLAAPVNAAKRYTMKCDYEILTVEIPMPTILSFANFVFVKYKDEVETWEVSSVKLKAVGPELYGFRINGNEFATSFHLSIYKKIVDEKDGVEVWESEYFPANRVERQTEGVCWIDGL